MMKVRNMILMTLCLICCGSCARTQECVFFNRASTLFINDSPVILSIDGDDFGLFRGSVSRTGRYAWGMIQDSLLPPETYRDTCLRTQGTIWPKAKKFVLYDLANKLVVASVDSLSFYNAVSLMSPDENWLWVEGIYPDSSAIINTSTGDIALKPPGSAWDIRWIGDDLYFIEGNEPDYALESYDPVSGKTERSFTFTDSVTYADSVFYYNVPRIIDPERIATIHRISIAGRVIKIVRNGELESEVKFELILSTHFVDSSIYVYGALHDMGTYPDDFGDIGLYRLDPIIEKPNLLFKHYQLASTYSIPEACTPMSLVELGLTPSGPLFIRRDAVFQHLFHWDRDREAMEELVDCGYIWGPIGVIEAQ